MAMVTSVPLYTVEDLENFPDDGNRYELLDGVLLVTPAPAMAHQHVASRIHVELARALQEPGIANVLGPGAIVLKPRTQLQPDILVIPARFSPRLAWSDVTEHWLAVEVLSRSSHVYDREFKRDAYFALGVEQVWLVDWRERCVDVCTARGESRLVRDAIQWQPGRADISVTIDLTTVFADLD